MRMLRCKRQATPRMAGPSGEGSSAFFQKSAQKTFIYCGILRGPSPIPRESKVFCFFFSKKKRFLPSYNFLRAVRQRGL
jgi:hypothetical protein